MENQKIINMRKYIFTILLIATSLAASAQELYTTIDVLRPGLISLPQDVSHVLVVNNAVTQPHNYGHQSRLSGQMPSNIEIDIDSAVFYYLTSFTQQLNSDDYFGGVDLLEQSQNIAKNFYQLTTLNELQIDHLYKLYDIDALIVLNRLMLSDIVEDAFDTEFQDFYASLEVKCTALFSVYFPNQAKPQAISISDTLIWEYEDINRTTALNKLPNRRDALLDMAIYSAERAAKKILPHWQQVDRFFYTHNDKTMRAAVDQLYRKHWDEAINLWYEAYQTGKSKIKARAAANMAATFEIEGDLQSAYYWAKTAAQHFDEGFFTSDPIQKQKMLNYAKELQIRIQEDKQMNQL